MSSQFSEHQKEILVLCLERKFLTSQEMLAELWGCLPQEQGITTGKAQYNTAHASLSRALTRLYQRGLVEIWKNLTGYSTGIILTDAGANEAEALIGQMIGKPKNSLVFWGRAWRVSPQDRRVQP